MKPGQKEGCANGNCEKREPKKPRRLRQQKQEHEKKEQKRRGKKCCFRKSKARGEKRPQRRQQRKRKEKNGEKSKDCRGGIRHPHIFENEEKINRFKNRN